MNKVYYGFIVSFLYLKTAFLLPMQMPRVVPNQNQGDNALLRPLIDEVIAGRRDAANLNRMLIEQNARNNERNAQMLGQLLQHNAQRFEQVVQLLNNQLPPQNLQYVERIQGELIGLVQPEARTEVGPTQAARVTGVVLDRIAEMLNDPVRTAQRLMQIIGVIRIIYPILWPNPAQPVVPQPAAPKKDKPKKPHEQKKDEGDWCSYRNKPVRRERKHLQRKAKHHRLSQAEQARLAELDDQKRRTFKRK